MAKELGLKEFLDSEQLPEISTLNFEKGMKILEELVQAIEAGNLSLDKSINAYERGSILMNHLRQLLEGAEQKLKLVQVQPK